MKRLSLLMLLGFTFLLSSCTDSESNKIKVAVSIVPQQAILEAVAGDLVEVVTVIPPGNSPANYDPDARTMAEIMSSEVYFTIGVPTEAGNILGELDQLNVVHLEEFVRDVYPDRFFEEVVEDDHDDHDEHEHEGRDPHIWLSLKRMIVMTEVVRDELISIDPTNESVYFENANDFIGELQSLDAEIKLMFGEVEFNSFIIFHPSFGYFADDYQLNMLELEEGGTEATAKRLQEVIDYAREHEIKTIFHQEEISSAQVLALVEELDAKLVLLTPLSADYLNNYRSIAESIRESFNE